MRRSRSSRTAVINPTLWTPSELVNWLNTFESGRYSSFVRTLQNFTGEELAAFTNTQWGHLEPLELGKSLRYSFMGLVAISAAAQADVEDGSLDTTYSVLETSRGSKYPTDIFQASDDTSTSDSTESVDRIPKLSKAVDFPPLLPDPSVWHLVLVLIIAVLWILAVTVWKETLANNGITSKNLWKYASIPLISIGFTYFHIWLALYMTFYPLAYVGCLQIPKTNTGFGWQGIIPFKAEDMARKSVRMITSQLMDVKEMFSRIEPSRVATEIEPILHEAITDIIDTMASKYNPALWKLLPAKVKEEIYRKVKEESPTHIENMMLEIRSNIEDVFDIEDMVVSNMLSDPQLLVNTFVTCGYNELAFIRNSGAYLGGIFGLAQMGLHFVYKEDLVVFPVFGLLVGTITNWLALKVIFSPVNPVPICCGKFELQGLFLKRQHEVSGEYGRMVAADVLNSKNIIEAILKGPCSDKLFELVYSHVKASIDSGVGSTEKILHIGIGEETYRHIKEDACELITQKFPDSLRHIESYATKALDLEVTLRDKMRQLPPDEFEGLLHPVFQEDEWKLVLMGGAMGVVIGLVQAFGIN